MLSRKYSPMEPVQRQALEHKRGKRFYKPLFQIRKPGDAVGLIFILAGFAALGWLSGVLIFLLFYLLSLVLPDATAPAAITRPAGVQLTMIVSAALGMLGIPLWLFYRHRRAARGRAGELEADLGDGRVEVVTVHATSAARCKPMEYLGEELVGLMIDPLVAKLVGVHGVRFHDRFREVIELLRTLRDGVNSVGFQVVVSDNLAPGVRIDTGGGKFRNEGLRESQKPAMNCALRKSSRVPSNPEIVTRPRLCQDGACVTGVSVKCRPHRLVNLAKPTITRTEARVFEALARNCRPPATIIFAEYLALAKIRQSSHAKGLHVHQRDQRNILKVSSVFIIGLRWQNDCFHPITQLKQAFQGLIMFQNPLDVARRVAG
jgi:hypothetical protein